MCLLVSGPQLSILAWYSYVQLFSNVRCVRLMLLLLWVPLQLGTISRAGHQELSQGELSLFHLPFSSRNIGTKQFTVAFPVLCAEEERLHAQHYVVWMSITGLLHTHAPSAQPLALQQERIIYSAVSNYKCLIAC